MTFRTIADEQERDHPTRLHVIIETNAGLVVIDGKLIEIPVLREMHRLLAIAERP